MKQKRLKPAIRKQEIIDAALRLASKSGYTEITRNQIAEAAGITGPAVQYHFETMAQLRRQLRRGRVLGSGQCSGRSPGPDVAVDLG